VNDAAYFNFGAATMKYYFFVKQNNLIVREEKERQNDLNGKVVAKGSLLGRSRGGHSCLGSSSSAGLFPSFCCPSTFQGDSFLPFQGASVLVHDNQGSHAAVAA